MVNYNLKIGSPIKVHAYKSDGTLYREWKNVFIVKETDEFIVLANDRAIITERFNIRKVTSNTAIWILFKNRWFNIMYLPKKGKKIKFYCNIASPFIIESNTIKYIDYDLDFKVNESGNFKIIDVDEYHDNSNSYCYSKELKEKIDEAVLEVKKLIKTNSIYFTKDFAVKWKEEYANIKKEKKNG